MKWDELEQEPCSMARTIGVIGDRWTLLILRECFLRTRRFEGFQSALGITRHLLAERLKKLVRQGVLRRIPYQESPKRHEYILTQKGLDLYPIMMALVHWGDTHMVDERGRPLLHRAPQMRQELRSGHGVLRMRRAAFGQGGSYPPRPRGPPAFGTDFSRQARKAKDPQASGVIRQAAHAQITITSSLGASAYSLSTHHDRWLNTAR